MYYILPLVLLFFAAASVTADTCSSVLIGDSDSCYAARSACSYDPLTGVCLSGSPTDCTGYYYDNTGCAAASYGCIVSGVSGLCTIDYGASADYCQATYSSVSDCTTAGCYWNPQSSLCWNSIASDGASNPCSTWTSQTICSVHSCNWIQSNFTCGDPIEGSLNNDVSLSYTSNITFSNGLLASGSLNFSVNVSVPLMVDDVNPVWSWIRIGDQWGSSLDDTSMCSTGLNNRSIPVSVNLGSYGTTLSAMKTYITDWISATGTMQFDTSPNGLLAAKLLGSQNTMYTVTYDGVTNLITYHINSNLITLYAKCHSYGVTETVTSTDTVFDLPIGIATTSVLVPTYNQNGRTFIIDISTSGTTLITLTSTYYQQASIATAGVNSGSCATGFSNLIVSYYLSYSGVYNTTQMIGPRSGTDIVISPTNCYGDTITSFQFQGCTGYTCYYYIEMTSQCTVLTPDGLAFDSCSVNAAEASVHAFTVDIYSCPINNAASAACVLSSPHTPITSQINIVAFPGQHNAPYVFDVEAGVLPTPTTIDLSQFIVITSGTTQLNNQQLENNQTVTVLLAMTTPIMQQGFYLYINTGAGFSITPVDSNGYQLPSATQITWDLLAPCVTYIPKMVQLVNPSAQLLPIVQHEASAQFSHGFDGFAFTSSCFKQLAKANGGIVQIPYSYIIGNGANTFNTNSVKHSRKLLSTTTGTTSGTLTSNGTAIFTFQITETAVTTGSSSGVTLSNLFFLIIISVVVLSFMVILCVMMYCMYRVTRYDQLPTTDHGSGNAAATKTQKH